MYVFTGKLKVKRDTEQVNDRFKKREFVVTDDSSNYPQHVMFQLVQERCDLIDQFEPGEDIKVSFRLKGREWQKPNTDKVLYFNSLEAWKIEGAGPPSQSDQPPMPTSEEEPPPMDDEDDDLPF